MFELVSSIPLSPATTVSSHEIFALATHPTLPIYSIGISTGHVHTFNLPTPSNHTPKSSQKKKKKNNDDDQTQNNGPVVNGQNTGHSAQPRRSSLTDTGYSGGAVETLWKTRRHKGSCRALAFSVDGKYLFSAGSDGIIKVAHTRTGIVVSKTAVPYFRNGVDAPTNLCLLSNFKLAISTDAGFLHIYDLSLKKEVNHSSEADAKPTLRIAPRPSQTHQPHLSKISDDPNSAYISSITPLPPSAESTSNLSKLLFTTGGMTVSITDIVGDQVRFNSVGEDDDEDFSEQEDLLSSIYVPLPGSDTGVVAVGDGSSTLIIFERGEWRAPIVKEKINFGGDTLDTLCLLPESVAYGNGRTRLLAAGCGDGRVVLLGLEVVGENATGAGGKKNKKKTVKNVKVRVEKTIHHDDEMIDGVAGIGWLNDAAESDSPGRMITVGGNTVRVWGETEAVAGAAENLEGKYPKKRKMNEISGGRRPNLVDSSDQGEGEEEDDDDDERHEDNNNNNHAVFKHVQWDDKTTKHGDHQDDSDEGDVNNKKDEDSESESGSDSHSQGKKRRKRKKGKNAKKARMVNGNSDINIKLKGL